MLRILDVKCGVVVLFANAVGCGGLALPPPPNDGGATDAANADGANETAEPCIPSSFCATQANAFFCSDFDDGSGFDGWLARSTNNDASLEITTTQAVSCPNSVHMLAGNSNSNAGLGTNLFTQGVLPHVVLTLKAILPSVDTKVVYIHVWACPTGNVNANYPCALLEHLQDKWFLGQLSSLDELGTPNVALDPPPLTGEWNALTFDMHVGAPSTTVLTYTGTDRAVHEVTLTQPWTNPNNGMWMSVTVLPVGIAMTPPADGSRFDAYYDDVLVTTPP